MIPSGSGWSLQGCVGGRDSAMVREGWTERMWKVYEWGLNKFDYEGKESQANILRMKQSQENLGWGGRNDRFRGLEGNPEVMESIKDRRE